MACVLLKMDSNTRFAVFSIDNESDLENLPKIGASGKGDGNVSTIKSVSQGSKAIGTNGTNYILTGKNEWEKYSTSSSSGGGGSSGGYDDSDLATNDDIDDMFP